MYKLIYLFALLFASCAQAQTEDFEKDRQAILGMLGEYKVSFDFKETVALTPGYEIKPAKLSGANEVVILIEDSGSKIVLQHLLVSNNGHVTKHWRQDWEYEAKQRFEFTDEQTFTRRSIPAQLSAKAWTQCVYEVSDAPRYCGTGKWNHKYGNPTWTSDRSWRPLPRREYTTRSDYNAINAENRHTITPNGWTHEQDNSKVVRGESKSSVLVREFGFNDYRKLSGFDFTPAYDYWKKTESYWAKVRQFWSSGLDEHTTTVLRTPVDGMPIIEATFEQASLVAKGKKISTKDVESVLSPFVDHPEPLARK
jgi:hypothetical protein